MQQPDHIAIIMDGNGRWAEARNRHRTFGHIKGARTARRIIEHASQSSLKHLTLFAFSTENWSRPHLEISLLMTLLRRHLVRERETLIKNNIRFRAIGFLDQLPSDVLKEVQKSVEITTENTGLQLTFALNYGGRSDITQAMKGLAKQVQEGFLRVEDIDEDLISKNLWTHPLPVPDLIIRTSGEMRLSNFLLWQSAYSEMFFTDVNWPDFTVQEFQGAIQSFQKRQRRFGHVSPPSIESRI